MKTFGFFVILTLSLVLTASTSSAQSLCARVLTASALPSDLHLRSAQKDDVGAVIIFIHGMRENLGVDPFITADYRPTFSDFLDFEKSFQSPNGKMILLQNEKKEVKGTAAFSRVDASTCELKKFYLAKDTQGKGLGAYLLETIMSEARAAGFKKMILQTDSAMSAAIHLYEKYGFTQMPSSVRNHAVYFVRDPL